MATLQYASFEEINGSTAQLLDFAQTLKDTHEGQSKGRSITSYVAAEVSVAGKPFSIAAQLNDLSRREMWLDEMPAEDVMRLHKACTLLKKMESSWSLSDHLQDPGLQEKLESLASLSNKSELGQRMGATLVQRPPEHQVKPMFRP